MLRRLNKRGRPRTFKAKTAVYYLLGWVVILTFLSFSYQHLTAEWKIASASEDLTVVRAAQRPVQELNEENSELKTVLKDLPPTEKVVIVNDGSAKSKAMFKARKVWGDEHLAAFERLVMSESGFNPSAQNKTSTAYGMFQFLDSTWNGYSCEKTEEVDHQIDCGIKYIKARYGDPNNAWAFWLEHHWY